MSIKDGQSSGTEIKKSNPMLQRMRPDLPHPCRLCDESGRTNILQQLPLFAARWSGRS